jgi:hypothetical protein
MDKDFCKAIGLDKKTNDINNTPEILSLLEKADNKKIRAFLGKRKLPYLNAGGRDPIATFLFNLRKWQIALVVFIAMIVGLLPSFVSWQEGTFYNLDMELCFAKDYGFHDLVLAMIASLLMVSMYFSEIPRTLLKLNISNVFDLDVEKWKDFVDNANTKFSKIHLTLIPYGIAILIAAIASFEYLFTDANRWYRISFTSGWKWAGFAQIPVILFTYYLIALLVIRIVVVYFILRDFFKNSPAIQPLHPDNCGGLSSLGELSMKLNLGVFLFGIISFIAIYVNLKIYQRPIWYPLNIMTTIGYFTGSSILFFLPMFSTHNAMKRSKNKMIQKISDRFLRTINNTIKIVEGNTPIKDELDELDSLKKIYDVASKMPVYPFNFTNVTSYLGSIVTPVLIFVIQQIITFYYFKG